MFKKKKSWAKNWHKRKWHLNLRFALFLKTRHLKEVRFSQLTCFQFFALPEGSFFHRLTRSTQALQISPCLSSFNWKQPLNNNSYFDEDVNLELEDFAPQMQHPRRERKTRGLCEANITQQIGKEMKRFLAEQNLSAESSSATAEKNRFLCREYLTEHAQTSNSFGTLS